MQLIGIIHTLFLRCYLVGSFVSIKKILVLAVDILAKLGQLSGIFSNYLVFFDSLLQSAMLLLAKVVIYMYLYCA